MGIDVSWLGKVNEASILTLELSDYSEISPAIQVLEHKTGVSIDPYGDTRLSPSHASILALEIRKLKPKQQDILCLLAALETSVSTDDWLLFIGD